MKQELIDAAWEHGRVLSEADGEHWRQDTCGAWMRRDHFGREDSDFGWKLEKVAPGAEETADNVRPFHLRNGYDLASRRAHCRVTADRSNVPAERYATPPRNRAV
jgi:hypothetical protein